MLIVIPKRFTARHQAYRLSPRTSLDHCEPHQISLTSFGHPIPGLGRSTRGFVASPRWKVKAKITNDSKGLAQGLLGRGPPALIAPEDEIALYPPVIQQARNNMRKFENCVLLTKVGGFYELYFEQAEQLAPLLNINPARKPIRGGTVPMAGFPFFQLDRFLKILVQDLHKYVAISEEFAVAPAQRALNGGNLFDRRVTRIVTPGTLVDEKFMDPFENNFLMALCVESPAQSHEDLIQLNDSAITRVDHARGQEGMREGMAWLDLSTGEFFTESTSMSALPSNLVRIGPREIVLNSAMDTNTKAILQAALGHHKLLVTWQHQEPLFIKIEDWTTMLESEVPSMDHGSFTSEEIAAGSSVLDYAKTRLLGMGMKLQIPKRRSVNDEMTVDRNTMKGLEILETAREAITAGKGSLLHSIRRTVTKSGARLLRDRISSPSTSLTAINHRLDLVAFFVQDAMSRENVLSLLKQSFDSQRLVQKFSLGRGDADDLISLYRTIKVAQSVKARLEAAAASLDSDHDGDIALRLLLERFSLESPGDLAARIAAAIDEESLLASHDSERIDSASMVAMAQAVLAKEGSEDDVSSLSQVVRSKAAIKPAKDQSLEEEELWIMRRSASQVLDKLHNSLASAKKEKIALVASLRARLGAPSLHLKWTPGLGHICHVKGVRDVKMSIEKLSTARSVSTTKSTRSFYLSEWSALGTRTDQVKLQIRAEEQRLFQELREEVVKNLVKLRRNAVVLDELDVACSSATLALEQGLVRPVLTTGTSHRVVAGRHPTVKLGLEEQGRAFVSNDCFVGARERVWFITGPNMAGKSTFLRQNALISILAQIGSYVPAAYAEIGIVDKIFSRIGSADNLYQDQSTFMVEMLETAAILQEATSRSFVIMDEIGRGTTPEDGIAVSYACLHHLYHVNKCRTLFATHFHVLAEMTAAWTDIGRYCTDVSERDDGSFTYIHQLRPGVNRESHALKVAKLAGVPESVLHTTKKALEGFRSSGSWVCTTNVPATYAKLIAT